MKLHFQNATADYLQNSSVRVSRAQENSTRYAQEKNINTLSQQNIINNYFETFDASYSEVSIKNLIAARLQPSYVLPELHDHKALSAKAEELLSFSLAI
jgi:hypothetical protein